MKIIPDLYHEPDDTSPAKRDHCDTIRIRHDSDIEWEQSLPEFFFHSSKLSSALSAPLWLSQLFQEKKGGRIYSSCIRQPSKARTVFFFSVRACSTPPCVHVLTTATTIGMRSHGASSSKHPVNHVCVCTSVSLSLLPHSWPPCEPQLPTRAAQLRCDHWSRPSWVRWSHATNIEGRGTHKSNKKRRKLKMRVRRKKKVKGGRVDE
jgi:hypothetical protein